MARNAELEAAIGADPDSEAAYVVYGDWLQVQGDPRGELVAVQLALETARGERWGQLKRRELELLQEHAGALFGPVTKPECQLQFDWRRGFIDRVRGHYVGTEYELLVHPSLALVRAVGDLKFPTLRAAAPRHLTELAIEHHALAAMLARPGLRHLGFAQGPNLFAEPEPALVERSELVSLAVAGVDLARYGACAFPELRSVRAEWPFVMPEPPNRMPGERYRRVAAAQVVRRAEQAAQLAFVARTPHAALDLALHQQSDLAPLQDAGAAARRVGALRLQDFDVPQLRALQPLVPGLRSLQIFDDWEGQERKTLTRAHVDALPGADQLTHLEISRPITDPEVAAALGRSPYARTLESLRLMIFDGAVLVALGRGEFPALRVLELQGLPGVDVGVLAAALPSLEELVLSDCPAPLSDSRLAARVQTLTFRGPHQFGPRWLPALRGLTALRRVRFNGELSPAAIETLAALDVPIEIVPHVPMVDARVAEPTRP